MTVARAHNSPLTASLKRGSAAETGTIDLHRGAAAADRAEARGAGGLHGAALQAIADAWARLAAESVDMAGPAGPALPAAAAGIAVTAARSEATDSLGNGRVTADACVGLPELGLRVATTPCAFSPCSGWPRSSRWRSKLSVCPNTNWIQLG